MHGGQPCTIPVGRGELRQVGNRRRVVPGRPSAAAMIFDNLVSGELVSVFGGERGVRHPP